MRIHGMCLVRDEADIIAHTLRAATAWCDFIYVLDNGSSDGSWEIVNRLARDYPAIVPFAQSSRPFDVALRGEIFRRFRANGYPGDWWCRLDADEVYEDDPRGFLGRVTPEFDHVWAAFFQFYFTDLDLSAYRAHPERFGDDLSPNERYRYYKNNWSELRFFRQKRDSNWPTSTSWPVDLRRVCPERIRMRHYQYRSPEQIQSRLFTRRQAMKAGRGFQHERLAVDRHSIQAELSPHAWLERVREAADLECDRGGDGELVLDERAMPRATVPLPRRLLPPRAYALVHKTLARHRSGLLGSRFVRRFFGGLRG